MIHQTAVIDPRAEFGNHVEIGPFAYIEGGVRVGDGCMIGPHVSLMGQMTLGAGCRVHAGAVLGDVPQDKSYDGAESRVVIGSNCVIREGVTIHRGTKAGTVTEIGDDCFLMAFSHFAHNVKLGRGVVVANGALLAGYVELGERVFVSGHVCIHQFVKVGRLALLGGGSLAGKDVPPFCILRDLEFNKIAGLNVVGMRRAGLSAAERDQVKSAYKLLYRSGLNVSQAVEKIKATFESGPALEFCRFIGESKRGICSAASDLSE